MPKSNARSRLPNPYVLPAIAYITALTIFPQAYLIYLSLLKWNVGFGGPEFIGLANYLTAFTDPAFLSSILLTFGFALFVTVVELGLGVGVAVLLNRTSVLSSVIRNLLIIPLMMTPFLVYLDWKYLLLDGVGPIPYVIGVLTGNPSPVFFSSVPNVYLSFLAIDAWEWLPFVVVLVLAGMSSFSREPFEAAQIDGAGRVAQFRYITLPLLRPILIVVVLFRFVDSLKLYELVATFTGGGPNGATNFTSYLIQQTGLGIGGEIGVSAAYGQVFSIAVLAVSWALMYVLYRNIRSS